MCLDLFSNDIINNMNEKLIILAETLYLSK